jgi:hypothetical protein
MAFSFKGLASKFVSAAKAVKATIVKAAADAPGVVKEVDADAPEVEALVNLVFPGATAVEQVAFEVFEAIADAVEASGPAAAQNGLSVSLDKALIAKVQSVSTTLKAASAKL